MEPNETSSLLPALSLTIGNTEIKPVLTPEYSGHDSDESSPNDPNRFNAYLNRGSELWTHWEWLGGQGKMSLMRCNYCLVNKQLKNAPKCRRHLIKCPKTPDIVRKYFEKKEVEATRVSALMRELRSKEIKFSRSDSKSTPDTKIPVPTANDLKHLQHKQHQASINSVIVNGSSSSSSPVDASLSGSTKLASKHVKCEVDSKANHHQQQVPSPLVSGKHSRSESVTNGGNHNSRGSENLFTELSLFYQQMMTYHNISSLPVPTIQNGPESFDLSKSLIKNGHMNGNGAASHKLKRKLSPSHDTHSINTFNGQIAVNNTNKENKELRNSSKNGVNNTTVVINLDDVNLFDEGFFNPIDNGFSNTPLNASRKKKRDSSHANGFTNGRFEGKNGTELYRNSNGFNTNFHLNSNDLEIAHDDLNDLLASSLISSGIEFEFINNPYFQKFIAQLVNQAVNKNYKLPSVDKLSMVNLNNLIRKFDYETAKIFSECDSIIVSFDLNKEKSSENHLNKSLLRDLSNEPKLGGDLDVNLLISSSNVYSQLYYKTIPSFGSDSPCNSKSTLDLTLKSFNNQIDSLLSQIGPDRINAVILPYDEGRSTELLYAYLSDCHSHMVLLTNSYQLFHHLLCDICKIPSIHRLLSQCINLFRELAFNFSDFQEENQNLWKRVFESDNLKLYKHLKECSSSTKNTYWISLNLMLCWFLVAKASIIDLFSKCSQPEMDSTDHLNNLLDKIKLETSQIEQFFNKISVLFNFLTPIINAIHLIENESTVISDIIKIYFDVKLAINTNNYFDGINMLCDKTERQSIDCILHNYLQEQNFSRFFFLAYYLDPRYRDDKRIDESEELIAQVYDTLFSYANALGCVSSKEEDREKLVDSLDEFRNGVKLYGMQLLKCPKSPTKFWKHLGRFPGSQKLAFCASRLLSISTRSMLLTAPLNDKCTSSLNQKILNENQFEFESKATEKVLPIKSYLLSHCEPIPNFDEGDKVEGKTTDSSNGVECSLSNGSISDIISNVITSLDQSSLIIAQPFSPNDLSRLLQSSN